MQLSPGTSRRRLVDPTQPPTLIEPETAVLWAGATVAGSRPASPAQPSLHYATDTPAVTLWDGSTWRSMGGATLPSASAAGQMLLSTGSGTSYAARARVLSGTLAERDALSPVREGDQWYVSSGSGSGTFWKRVNGAWRFRSVGATADDVLAELGAIKAPTSPTAGHVLTYDGSVWQSAAPATAGLRSEDMTGDGWSSLTATGGATATWAGGALVLDINPAAMGFCGAEIPDLFTSPEDCVLAVRVRVVNGDNSSATRISFNIGSDDENTCNFAFWTNGTAEPAFVNGGSYSALALITVTALTHAVRTGGELWFLITRTHDAVSWKYGINTGASGALPTKWVPIYSTVDHAGLGYAAAARNAVRCAAGTYCVIVGLTMGSGVNLDVEIPALRTGRSGDI